MGRCAPLCFGFVALSLLCVSWQRFGALPPRPTQIQAGGRHLIEAQESEGHPARRDAEAASEGRPARRKASVPAASEERPPARQTAGICGDGECDAGESIDSCFADCPGVTTPAVCGEEPHSDVGGDIPPGAPFGMDPKARAASAAECCERCVAHAADPKHAARPCNSWAFCPLPICWGLDTGWNHTHGECWLKSQRDPQKPLYGQRGAYTDEYRRHHRNVRGGPPSHVPWTGGVLHRKVDRSVKWQTGPNGMTSSAGDEMTNWRAWEASGTYEKRLAAGEAGASHGAMSAKK